MNDYLVYLPLLLVLLWALFPIFQRVLDIRTKSKLAKAWDGYYHLGRKRDLDVSLEESLRLDKSLQAYDFFVDDQTWHDLDFQKIFRELDDAYSSLGSECLYNLMRLQQFEEDRDFATLQEELRLHPDQRLEMQLAFFKLGKKNYNQAKSLVSRSSIKGGSLFYLELFIGGLPLLGLLLMVIDPLFWGMFTLVTAAVNIGISLKTQISLNARLEQMNYLVIALAAGHAISKVSFSQQRELKENLQYFSWAKLLGGFFIRKNSTNEMDLLGMYANMLFLLPNIAQSYMARQLQHHQRAAADVLATLGKLEAAISVLHYRERLPVTCQPDFHEQKCVMGQGLYHPLLDNPVPNDVDFSANIVISGDNASGKSTYLRTVAVNILLAQSLGFACGVSLELMHGHVLTAMDVSDDIETGDSYFITESRAIQRMISSLSQPDFHYLFIDELFKGTNTVERIGAGLGIVRWFACHPCLYMVSSHDIELVSASHVLNRNYHFDSQYVNGEIVFDYLIKPGASVTKNAVNTLESLHYPEDITQIARQVISHT
ncbi:MutS-related protein, partial [Streptococcus sp. DD10]|uniref:MutS-related protein n=1 Tax=Streptococcus sp. DD10 TaxID=1777878 RepID=UPI0009ED8DB6